MGISLNSSSLLNGQGLDVNSLVSQIMNQKSGQLTEWQNEQTTLQLQAGALKSINDDLSALATAVTTLADPLGPFTVPAATSSNTSIVTASATTSAPAGTHTVVVHALATVGLIYTDAFASGANASILADEQGSADLKLQIGGTNGTTADIQITQGSNDTLTTLAQSINQQGSAQNWGITASVVTDADGAHLSIVSQATGQPGAIALITNTTALSFSAPVGGTNASVSIDGAPYRYTTNTIAPGAISGVTLNLNSAAPNTPVQLSVGFDVQKATDAINTFVSAYNKVITDINQQYAVNPATDSQGPLAPDSALRCLQSSLLNDVTYSISDNNGLVNLASLGINMNDDGTLTVGTTPAGQSVTDVMTGNPTAFLNFFQNVGSTGFANNFHTDLTSLSDSTIGPLSVDLNQNKAQQQTLADTINNFESQLTTQQRALTDQFNKLNASLESYPTLLKQVTDILATMDTGSSNSSS